MKERILEVMQDVVKEQGLELTPDSVLEGLIDSITFIKMIVELENDFDFEFGDEMLIISKFPTVKDCVSYIESRIERQESEISLNDNKGGM